MKRFLTMLALLIGVSIVGSPAAAAAPSCSTASSPVPAAQSSTARPVVFVHGWTSSSATFHDTGQFLAEQLGNRIQPYYFDYAEQSTTWAGDDRVAGCLATYLTAVSNAYGGDSKVIVVAHSMGGLATLYAAGRNGVSNRIGGVVTFDTPYLGSPFGNRTAAGLLQGAAQRWKGRLVPPPGSDAQVCLGPHSDGAPLPSGCTSSLPSYLPAAVPVAQIAGRVTVRRTFIGIHLYDIDLGGDGIVPLGSSWGYLQMKPKSAWPKGAHNTLLTDSCTMTSDNVQTAIATFRLTKSDAAAVISAIGQFYEDNKALDDLLSGNATYAGAVYMAVAQSAAPCSHVGVVNDPNARNQALSAIKDYLATLQPATSTVTLAPVDGHGKPLAGWTVDTSDLSRTGVDCSFNDASPAAPKGNIYYCSPSSATADACWVTADRVHILCLRDPYSHTLVEYAPDTMPTAAAQHTDGAQPIRLDLDNGDHCRLRNGGSWDGRDADPDLAGTYACTKAEAIWGGSDNGINKTSKLWTVRTGNATGPLTAHTVATAYYVATAP